MQLTMISLMLHLEVRSNQRKQIISDVLFISIMSVAMENIWDFMNRLVRIRKTVSSILLRRFRTKPKGGP